MPTNLPEPQSNSLDQEQYFTQYYDTRSPVSGDQYDAVYVFFLRKTNNNQEAAKSLTSSLLEVTYQNGIDPMLVLDDFKKYTQNESFRTALMSLFNSTRRNTSKIGFATDLTPSRNVVRNIRK